MERNILSRSSHRPIDPNIERDRVTHSRQTMHTVQGWSRVLRRPVPAAHEVPPNLNLTLPSVAHRRKMKSEHWGTQSAPTLPALTIDGKQKTSMNILSRTMMRTLYHHWMESYSSQGAEFTSLAVWAEVVLVQVLGSTRDLPSPNLLRTAVCSFLLDKITPLLGQYSHIVNVIKAELNNSIYQGHHHDLTHVARTPRLVFESPSHVPETGCYVDMELYADGSTKPADEKSRHNGTAVPKVDRMLHLQVRWYRVSIQRLHFRAWRRLSTGGGSGEPRLGVYVKNMHNKYLAFRYFKLWSRFTKWQQAAKSDVDSYAAMREEKKQKVLDAQTAALLYANGPGLDSKRAALIDKMTLESVMIKWANVILEGVCVITDFDPDMDSGEKLANLFCRVFPDIGDLKSFSATREEGVSPKDISQFVIDHAIVKGMPLGLVVAADILQLAPLRIEMRLTLLMWIFQEWYASHKASILNGTSHDEKVDQLAVTLDIGMRHVAWDALSTHMHIALSKRMTDKMRSLQSAVDSSTRSMGRDVGDIPKETLEFTVVSEAAVMDELKFARIIDTSAEVREINRVLNTHAADLRKVFMFYSGLSEGSTDMNKVEFWRFVEDTKLITARNLSKQTLDAAFRKSLSRVSQDAKELSGNKFVEVLCKVAAMSCAGGGGVRGCVSNALDSMIRNDVVPRAMSSEKEDFKQAVRQPKMQEVLSNHSKVMSRWFQATAKRVDGIDCIAMKAFCQFVTDMGWSDTHFTKNDAMGLFRAVQEAEDEAGDRFMDKSEFMFAIVAIGMHRVPSPLVSSANRVNQFFSENLGVRVRTTFKK